MKEQPLTLSNNIFLCCFFFITLNRSPKGKCSKFDQGQISYRNVFMDGLGDGWNLRGLLCSFLFLREQISVFLHHWRGIVWHLHKCSAYLWCVSCVCQAGPHGALNPDPKAASAEVRLQDWQVCEWQNEYFFRNISFNGLLKNNPMFLLPPCFHATHSAAAVLKKERLYKWEIKP